MLKRWTVGFNYFSETFQMRCLWVLLPDLPIEFWDVRVLKEIGDSIGKFVYFEGKDLRWEVKHIAWILVDCYLSVGFPEEIEIHYEEGSHVKVLDYWREPFRCHFCRASGHIKSICPLLGGKSSEENGEVSLGCTGNILKKSGSAKGRLLPASEMTSPTKIVGSKTVSPQSNSFIGSRDLLCYLASQVNSGRVV